MIRLHVVVEGQTEESFVLDVLAPHLWEHEVVTKVSVVRTSADARGGLPKYGKLRRHIGDWMLEDRNDDVRFTTMFDLYRLPPDWPGWSEAAELHDPYDRVTRLEDAVRENLPDRRLIPYIQVHEFEALLLSHPEAFSLRHPQAEGIGALRAAVARAQDNPELVDDTPAGHPSVRIQRAIPTYSKTVDGPRIAQAIGIDRMRQQCPHFNDWIDRLVALGS